MINALVLPAEHMFLYEFSGIKNCSLMNVMYGGASRLSQSNFTKCRHEKCPLHTVPEKKDEKSAEGEGDAGAEEKK